MRGGSRTGSWQRNGRLCGCGPWLGSACATGSGVPPRTSRRDFRSAPSCRPSTGWRLHHDRPLSKGVRGPSLLLSLAVFLSGAAGVLFETLWFRAAGLTLGNGFWSANIVLASFMAGLAAGNATAVRYARQVRQPLRLYAAAEVTV